ncbi:hypothetical protein LINPERPRIM_LOCUS980 [Linum perenne]
MRIANPEVDLVETPECIMLLKVPPPLITLDEISWVTSQLGKPIDGFVRKGLDVKVCLLRGESNMPKEVSIIMGDSRTIALKVSYPQTRTYKKESTGQRTWKARDITQPHASILISSSKNPKGKDESPELNMKDKVGGGTSDGPESFC